MRKAKSIVLLGWLMAVSPVWAKVFVQCPGDVDGDAIIDTVDPLHSDAVCRHLAGGDGFINMADKLINGPSGRLQYTFGFSDATGTPESQVITGHALAAEFSTPTLVLDEGDEFYLTLTTVGMVMRPDLADPHTVHWHGFPNASSIFDGLPESAIAILAGSSLTYYYNVVTPGTFMYHCHVEATEHMQMGMLGNLYVRPAQNRLPDGTLLGTHVHSNPDFHPVRREDDPLVGDKYVYNDGDGSTRYDVEAAIQLGSFDPVFHDANQNIQPLPFAEMRDTYALLNGRGYPDTINPQPLRNSFNHKPTQKIPSLIEARQGEKILLRLSNLSVTRFYTVTVLGIPMEVVGRGAAILRGGGTPQGKDLFYRTQSITLGGGEAMDAILDTSDVAPGTYFMYTTNLHYLSNNEEDLGGMMTEIVIHDAI